jgi:hypothetical protein
MHKQRFCVFFALEPAKETCSPTSRNADERFPSYGPSLFLVVPWNATGAVLVQGIIEEAES